MDNFLLVWDILAFKPHYNPGLVHPLIRDVILAYSYPKRNSEISCLGSLNLLDFGNGGFCWLCVEIGARSQQIRQGRVVSGPDSDSSVLHAFFLILSDRLCWDALQAPLLWASLRTMQDTHVSQSLTPSQDFPALPRCDNRSKIISRYFHLGNDYLNFLNIPDRNL